MRLCSRADVQERGFQQVSLCAFAYMWVWTHVPCALQVSLIEKLLTAFIQPLQQDNISTTHPRSEYLQAMLSADSSSSNGSSSSGGSPTVLLRPDADVFSSSSSSNNGSGLLLPDCPEWPEYIYRVHCSLNLNTETGRLSARRPNLQNQPALEKDRYKVRKDWVGKTVCACCRREW